MKVSTILPALGLGIDGGEMGAGQQVSHHTCRRTGIDKVVDDQHILAGLELVCDHVGQRLKHPDVALVLVIVALDCHAIDGADVELGEPRWPPAPGRHG